MNQLENDILITTSSFAKEDPDVLEPIKRNGFEYILNPYDRKITERELVELLEKYQPVGLLAGTETISRSVLEEAEDYLKVISRVGVGWDNVDRKAAEEVGIKVFRTSGVLSDAVAELTIGMILSALRDIPCQNRQVCGGMWQKGMGLLLRGKTVGIIGFGAIGQRVGELIRAFKAKILYYDPIPKDVHWAESASLSDLLRRADIITIHTSGSDKILGNKELKNLCKRGVILVNTSRGGVIDEVSLYQCLLSEHISFACLDVFDEEPYSGPLTKLDNVILTPHIGSYAKEARIQMEQMAVENLLKGLNKDTLNSKLK